MRPPPRQAPIFRPGRPQTTPLIAGVSIAVAAVSLRAGIQQFIKYQAMPKKLHYYKGGFLPEMTRREAALILGVRESAVVRGGACFGGL